MLIKASSQRLAKARNGVNMSKNIVIQEGGVAKNLTVDKLKTDLVGGGTCNWVPEDETQLITKSITKNGTHAASSDGAYGYSKVIVNVAGGSVTGKGSDGNTHTYSVDDQGNIVDEKVPDSISVTTPPSFVGPYGNRAYISFDGLVVHAYDSSGADMGAVPFEELVFPVTVAQYDPDAPASGGDATSDLVTSPVTMPIPFFDGYVKCDDDGGTNLYAQTFEYFLSGAKLSLGDRYGSGKSPIEIWASNTRNTSCIRKVTNKHDGTSYESSIDLNNSYTHNGLTVYYYVNEWSGLSYNIFANTDSERLMNEGTALGPISSVAERIAWTLIYGSSIPSGGTSIPVQWSRPGDGKILETSFNITVVPI